MGIMLQITAPLRRNFLRGVEEEGDYSKVYNINIDINYTAVFRRADVEDSGKLNSGCTEFRPRKILNSAIFPKFGQIRLQANFWPDLADANATAVRLVN